MKISILTPDFSHNCFGRAWLLAKVLQKNYLVEIIGPVFGDGIWGPLKNSCDFEIKMVKGYANGQIQFKKMLKMISGDVIYVSKPLMASFGVGLVKKITSRKPLVLDIDDWEIGLGKEYFDSLNWYHKIYGFYSSILNLNSYYYTIILNRFIKFADAITVSGNVMRSKYGGTVIWHGRDTNIFNPQKFSKTKFKKKYLPQIRNNLFVISFIGTPRPQKGLEDLIDAMVLIGDERFFLMIIGSNKDGYSKSLKKRAKDSNMEERIFFLPEQPFTSLPEFLAITDLVVIPQSRRSGSYAQVPAKIFDAMAMAKPIISTSVSDIPAILDDCGWIVEPGNPGQLAKTIQYVFDNPIEAKEKGKKAREKCKRKYSWEIMEEKLTSIFEKYKV